MTTASLRRTASVRIPTGAPRNTQGVWKSLLEGAARTAEFESPTVIVLGKKDTGKSSLIRALQSIGTDKRTLSDAETFGESYGVSGLDYAYLDVRALDDADTSEDLAKCNLWILQDPQHAYLLEPVVQPCDLHHMFIFICLDLSEPWTVKSQLTEWLQFAADFVSSLMKELPFSEQETLRCRLTRYLHSYRAKITGISSDTNEASPMPSVNLGVPIMVCVGKSDAVVNLNTRQYPGRADVMLAHIRHLCLPYGAAICYFCTKDAAATRNTELIYRYCVHRFFDFNFSQPITLQPPDGVFIPAGCDTAEEIETFTKGTVASSLDVPLESLLPPSSVVTPAQTLPPKTYSDSVSVLPMNDFLSELLAKDPSLAQRSKPTTKGTVNGTEEESPAGSHPGSSHRISVEASGRKSTRASAYKPQRTVGHQIQEAAPDTARLSTVRRHGDGASTARGDTESLRQFFQTLLTKQPTAGSSTARHRSSVEGSSSQKTKPEN